MGGERLRSAAVTTSGLAGDRCWAARDEVLGGIRGAKKFPALMRCHARVTREPDGPGDSGDVEITLPDGSTVTTTDESAAARVSSVLEHEVTIWPLQPAQDLDHYRLGRPTQQDPQAELRSVFGLRDDEPLPNFRRLPSELRRQINQYASLPGTYFDAFPILVLTTASLEALRRLRPDAVIDVRRFRPNIVVDTDPSLSGPVEHSWEGRTLRIGDVELELTWRCPRCVMITHGFDDIPADRSLMRTVVHEFGHELGIYAVVTTPGQISETETVTLS
jgi:uncharacterized protein YcbX